MAKRQREGQVDLVSDDEDVVVSTLASGSRAEPDEDIECIGQTTWEERDRRLRAQAVSLDTASPAAPQPPHDVNAEHEVRAEEVEPLVIVKSDDEPSSAKPGPALTAQQARAAELNTQQGRAVELAASGVNLFITGGAGTGKSFTLNRVITALEQLHGRDAVYKTASTGIAATVIGGTTLHSFAGIGMAQGTVTDWVRSMSKYSKARWAVCRALVIDEVSMLDGDFFDKLDHLARTLLGVDACFGGIQVDLARSPARPLALSSTLTLTLTLGLSQLVLCGDFFQLPPVGLVRDKLRFLFEARSWPAAAANVVLLTQVLRRPRRPAPSPHSLGS